MIRQALILAGTACMLSGCASYEGLYAPSCLAYAGSEIRLEHGRYVWTKFTDEIVVDEQGNTVDPFPGFPRSGEFEKQGAAITLAGDDGNPLLTMVLHRADGAVYLYTAEEAEAFEATGERPECPLRRQVPGTSK